MKEIVYDLYIHMTGQVTAESEEMADLIDAIFPDGYEGVIEDISTSIHFPVNGYVDIIEEDMDE